MNRTELLLYIHIGIMKSSLESEITGARIKKNRKQFYLFDVHFFFPFKVTAVIEKNGLFTHV